MTTLAELMAEVRAMRDALHDRFDGNFTPLVKNALLSRHLKAVTQARREVEDPSLPMESPEYAPLVPSLAAATTNLEDVADADNTAMLTACQRAGKALDPLELLP